MQCCTKDLKTLAPTVGIRGLGPYVSRRRRWIPSISSCTRNNFGHESVVFSYGRWHSQPGKKPRQPDSLNSGGSGHGLRIFRATLHRGEKDRESRLAHQADTHHPVDLVDGKVGKAWLSDSSWRPPPAWHERLDITNAIMWLRLQSGPINVASEAGRGLALSPTFTVFTFFVMVKLVIKLDIQANYLRYLLALRAVRQASLSTRARGGRRIAFGLLCLTRYSWEFMSRKTRARLSAGVIASNALTKRVLRQRINVSDWMKQPIDAAQMKSSDLGHVSADGASNAIGSAAAFELLTRKERKEDLDFDTCYAHQYLALRTST
ncbi:hypothetical protein THAOC_22282, partial [Thalassiosira oceanica]